MAKSKELNQYILQKAIQNRICEPWAQKISEADGVEQLLQMYVEGIDFCLSNNFPSNEDLSRLATQSQLNEFGIYLNQSIELADLSFACFLNKSTAKIKYSGFTVANTYINHSSTAEIIADDHSFLVIDIFDKSKISVSASGNSKVLVNVYGLAEIKYLAVENAVIKIINKNKGTY